MKTTILILGVLAYGHISAQCSYKGPAKGNSFSDNSSTGSVMWKNVSNASEPDDLYAIANVGLSPLSETSTHYLVATDFQFAIPSGASICGIEVKMERHYQINSGDLANISDKSIRLVMNGSVVGSDRSASETWSPGDAQTTYGNMWDGWGLVWTTADINSASFGVALSASVSSGASGLDLTAMVDDITITVYYNSILPVSFKEFLGAREQDHIKLSWITASESNSSHFAVEKMISGNRWTVIDSVPAAGNSADDKSYQSIDRSPESTNIYRIRQVDRDGHFIYSKSIRVYFNAGANIILRNYPNPVQKILTVESSAPFQWVQLTDLLGKVVLRKDLDAPAYIAMVNLAALPAGTYMLMTDKSAKEASKRVVIYR